MEIESTIKNILITGGTGMIGSRLTNLLMKSGYAIRYLSRHPDKKDRAGVTTFGWDTKKEQIDFEALRDVHAIIHLAGAGIADGRWTEERKKILVESRVKTADMLLEAVRKTDPPLECFISASGINYYGTKTSEHIFSEEDSPANDFAAELCQLWEEAADRFSSRCRVVKLRTATVLAGEGGALSRLATPVKLGLGAPLGSGKQYVPYIHIDDLCRMYEFALEHPDVKGAYNATNGDHITNSRLMKAVAERLHRPMWVPRAPAIGIYLAFGKMADLVLKGSRASSDKIEEAGFQFHYPDIRSALAEIDF